MPVEIVRVGPGEAALLECVAEDVFDEAIDPGLLSAYLAESGHLLVVAVADGAVVGQARGMVHRHPDRPAELYVDNLGVTPGLQRRGIATRMLDELAGWARDHGCTEGWVATETDNDAARRLYEARGAPGEAMMFYLYELGAP